MIYVLGTSDQVFDHFIYNIWQLDVLQRRTSTLGSNYLIEVGFQTSLDAFREMFKNGSRVHAGVD